MARISRTFAYIVALRGGAEMQKQITAEFSVMVPYFNFSL
jgi:hypothetical protein